MAVHPLVTGQWTFRRTGREWMMMLVVVTMILSIRDEQG
jgi:hypothetical protein